MSCDSAEHVLKCDLYDKEEREKYNAYIFTKLISNARTDGFRSVGLPNSKSHSFSLFITFFQFNGVKVKKTTF